MDFSIADIMLMIMEPNKPIPLINRLKMSNWFIFIKEIEK